MRKRYLKDHRPVLYSNLLTAGKLYRHLAEIDQACEDRMELLTRQMAAREGVTEALKAADQMEWVRRMNGIRNRAEEIIRQGDGSFIRQGDGSQTRGRFFCLI